MALKVFCGICCLRYGKKMTNLPVSGKELQKLVLFIFIAVGPNAACYPGCLL